MSLAIVFHFLCAQHVSDINISIIRSLRLFCWITTLVVLFLVRCVLEFRCGWFGVVSVLQDNVVIQQNSRKLLIMDILMSETCWAHMKWNKIASDIKLVFYSSTIDWWYLKDVGVTGRDTIWEITHQRTTVCLSEHLFIFLFQDRRRTCEPGS